MARYAGIPEMLACLIIISEGGKERLSCATDWILDIIFSSTTALIERFLLLKTFYYYILNPVYNTVEKKLDFSKRITS